MPKAEWKRFHSELSMPAKSSITIKDVALAAGCGIATASRVLNNSGPVSVAVREQVELAARTLGFRFSATGRALQSRRTRTIGCLVPSLANPVFAEAVQGVQAELAGSGYQMLISCSNYNEAADNAALETLLAQGVDALVATMVSPARSPALDLALSRNVPVSLMFHDPLDGFVSAHVDNPAAAREVARQFAALGHVRTGFVALRFSTSDRSRNRFAGFKAECAALGLEEPKLIEIGEAEAAKPDELAAILANHPELTGIFASNDFLAIAVQKSARLLGWHVPRDLSVVGFDGIEIGRLLEVPLATIETHPEAMGRAAAGLLLEQLGGGVPAQPVPLPFQFRAGATLAAPCLEKSDDGRAGTRPSSVPPVEPQAQTRMNR
jgi:DNA-binding LacI/PurR family transcriptional regulator